MKRHGKSRSGPNGNKTQMGSSCERQRAVGRFRIHSLALAATKPVDFRESDPQGGFSRPRVAHGNATACADAGPVTYRSSSPWLGHAFAYRFYPARSASSAFTLRMTAKASAT